MVAVFVHGVPETYRVWDDVRAALGGTATVALALPGFGAPRPDDWVPTKERYAAWVITQLEALGEPVDLVGHDWGCLLAQRVASTRPDLVRTLVCGGGPIDSDYVWHQTAHLFQTPAVGEQVMESLTPDAFAGALEGELGHDAARAMALPIDDTMKECILGLYRSAIDVGREWQGDVDALGASSSRMPVLVLWGRDDIYAPPEFGQRLAQRLGGEFLELDCGHFWPVLRPQRVAEAMQRFWTAAHG